MKKILALFSVLMLASFTVFSQESKINVVVIGAHPDDCDIKAGGTAVLYAEMGHKVMFVSVTNGDAGHHEMGGGALAKRRMAEAEEAGRRLGVKYVVLDNHDGELFPHLHIRLDLIRLIRNWNADIVISHRPNDYHPDHRNASILVQDAAYMVIVPNVAPDSPPLAKNPVFLYMEDRFQRPNPFRPDITIDVSSVLDKKYYGMAAHDSQFFEWLPWTAGRLEEVPAFCRRTITVVKKIPADLKFPHWLGRTYPNGTAQKKLKMQFQQKLLRFANMAGDLLMRKSENYFL
jgi:LmbE family N-acetylglucosaminyl deacetylase